MPITLPYTLHRNSIFPSRFEPLSGVRTVARAQLVKLVSDIVVSLSHFSPNCVILLIFVASLLGLVEAVFSEGVFVLSSEVSDATDVVFHVVDVHSAIKYNTGWI